MTNISDDMVNAALAAAYPRIWSARGAFQSNLPQSAARADELRERMIRALEAAQAVAPAPERSEEAQNLAIELGQLASRVARLAPAQPEQPVSTSNPSPEAQLIADFYVDVKTDRMRTITGFEVAALDGRLIQVHDEIKRLRAALKAAREAISVDATRSRAAAVRRESVLQSRIQLLEEEVRSLTVARPKTSPKTGSPITPPPLSDDVTEKIFDAVMGWMERGLDSINTKLEEGKKKDEL